MFTAFVAALTFALEIRQGGAAVTIEDHVAKIRRAPFELVVTVPDNRAFWLRADHTPWLYERAAKGEALGFIFDPFQTVAEAVKPAEEIVADSNAQHGWYHRGPNDTRCHAATKLEGGYRCTRRVRDIVSKDPITTADANRRPAIATQAAVDAWVASWPKPWAKAVEDLDSDSLFLVLLTGESDLDRKQIVEKGRDFVELRFTDPPVKTFAVEFIQDGQRIEIADHIVRLQRKPFDVVVTVKKGDGVYVHGSMESAVFDTARSGRWLGKTFKRANTFTGTMNDPSTLRLSPDEKEHGAWMRGKERHSFSSVEPLASGFRGTARVETVALLDNAVTVAETRPTTLYLVLYSGALSTTETGGRERQREWIRIDFPKR